MAKKKKTSNYDELFALAHKGDSGKSYRALNAAAAGMGGASSYDALHAAAESRSSGTRRREWKSDSGSKDENGLSAWERDYYGQHAGYEGRRRRLLAEDQDKIRKANEQHAARAGMNYNTYTEVMKTPEGRNAIRAREAHQETVFRPEADQKLNNRVTAFAMDQLKNAGESLEHTKGPEIASGPAHDALMHLLEGKKEAPAYSTPVEEPGKAEPEMPSSPMASGKGPMLTRGQIAENYADSRVTRGTSGGITAEQRQAAENYGEWNEEHQLALKAQQALDSRKAGLPVSSEDAAVLDEFQLLAEYNQRTVEEYIASVLGKEAPVDPSAAGVQTADPDELAAAADAGNAVSKKSAQKEYRDNSALAAQYTKWLEQVQEASERAGYESVGAFLAGEGNAYAKMLAEDEELQAGKALHESGSLSPTLSGIQQRQLDTYQGTATPLESEDALALLASGQTGKWFELWSQEYNATFALYEEKAKALQLMRMSGSATPSAIETAENELDYLDAQLEGLKAVSVMGRKDFAAKSQANAVFMTRDRQYMLVNDPGAAEEAAYQDTGNGITPTLYNLSYLMTDHERGVYNYLYADQGQAAADGYMQSIHERLKYRNAQRETKATEEFTQEHPVMSNVFSVIANASPDKLGQTMVAAGTAALGGELSPYDTAFQVARNVGAVRGKTNEMIPNDVGRFFYNTATSMADNLAAVAMGGGVPGLSALHMAATGYGQTAYDTMIRGGSTRDGALAGGAAAVTEFLMEKAGFDRLTRSWASGTLEGGYKGAFMKFLQGFIPEGLEEVPGNYVEKAVDEWMMGGNSKRSQRISMLMDQQKMTFQEAVAQADAEFTGEVVMSFMAGGVAGGTMQAVSYAGGVYQGKSAAKAASGAVAGETGVDPELARKAYEMEYGVREVDQGVIDEFNTQLEEAAETAGRAVTKASAVLDGSAVTVNGLKSTGKGAEVIVKQADGTENTIALSELEFDNPEMRSVYETASKYHESETAQVFLSGWENTRDTLDNYRKGFDAAYTSGFTGRELTGAAKTYAEALNQTVHNAAYKAGRAAQQAQEERLDMDEGVSAAVRRAVAHMPTEVMDGYTGAVNRTTGKLTGFQATQMAVADWLGKKFGVVYTFVNSGADVTGRSSIADEQVQGAYTSGTNQMVIALSAQESSLLSVAGHETLHFVKEWAGKNENTAAMYDEFQQFVLDKLQGTEGYDLDSRIAEKIDQYRRAGQELTRDGAIEEIVADSMATVFATDQNVQDFLESHDQTIVEKVVSTIKRFVQEIKNAVQRIAKGNAEAAAMLQQDADTLQEIADRFDRLAVAAGVVRENTHASNKQSYTHSFSLKDEQSSSETMSYYNLPFGEQVNKLMDGKVKGNGMLLVGRTPKVLRDIGLSDLPLMMDQTHAAQLRLGKESSTNDDHILSRKTIRNLPDLIADPVAVILSKEAKYRTKTVNIIIEAQSKNGKMGFAAVEVDTVARVRDGIADINKLSTAFGNKNAEKMLAEAIKRTKLGEQELLYINKQKARLIKLVASELKAGDGIKDGTNASIADAVLPVKSKSLQQTDTKQFRRWFRGSKVVDENGKSLIMYHGTREENGEFWTFDYSMAKKKGGLGMRALGKGNYFTSTKLTGSERYGSRVIPAYLSIKKPVYVESGETYLEVVRKLLGDTASIKNHDELQNELRSRGYDGVIQRNAEGKISIAVTFDSTQIKSATENVGLFDPKNPDIRYSLKDVDATNDEMRRVLIENKQLRDTVNKMQAQLAAGGQKVDPKTVRDLAKRFKEDSGTRVPLKTLTENIQTAFDAMANAKTTSQSEAAMEMMASIAQDMLEKSTHANRELYDEYAEMRKYFKGGINLTTTQWQEVKKTHGSNRAFRNDTAKYLKVQAEGAEGATLDSNWDELCERWPAFFKPDVNEGDQVEAVLAALEAVQITYENPYGANLPDYANDMAVVMFQEYMKAPAAKGTSARVIADLNSELDKARASMREQAARIRKLGRLEERIQFYRDAARGKTGYARQAQRRKDHQDYAKARAQIIRQRDQLFKKLTAPKSGAFVPQSMHDAVMELLRSIDFEGRMEGFTDRKARRTLRAASLETAKTEYMNMAKPDADGARGPFAAYVNGDLESDFDLLIKECDGMAAKDLSMRQMNALRNIVAGYTAAVVNADTLFMEERRNSLSETGDSFLAGMYTRRERMKQGKAAEFIRSATSKGLLKPVTVFHQFKGTAMEPVWKALRNAEGVHIRHVSEAEEFLQDALKRFNQQESIRTEDSAKHNKLMGKKEDLRTEDGTRRRMKTQVYKTADGRTLQLTDQELMTLYATWKREQLVGTRHLMEGGFTLANASSGSSTAPIRITGPDLQEMLDRLLTQEQKAYVDHMVGFLSTDCAEWGNEVTLKLYGVEKFHEEYYIPFKVPPENLMQEPAMEQDSRLKTGSFTKALTPQASSPIEIRPFTEVWCEHVEKMSDYNAFVLPIEDMTRLMNYRSGGETVRAAMKRYHSPEAADYIMNFLSRLNGNSRGEAGGSWLNTFMSKAKGAAVTFNMSVAIQQMGSASRAMSMIDAKYFLGGVGKATTNWGKRVLHRGSVTASYEEMCKYAPIGILKGWGYFDTNMAKGLYTRAQGKYWDKLSDFGGKLAELGDRAAWAQIWEAVKLETADLREDLEAGSKEYFAACAERFQEVVDATQVVDSVFQRAEWATEKGLMKQQVAFMSEPLATYNMIYRAAMDISNAGDNKTAKLHAWKRLSRASASIVLANAITAALKSVVSATRDRDNEKKDEEGNIVGVRDWGDKYLDSLGSNFVENIFGIGTIFTNMIQGAFSFYSSDLSTQWLSDFAGAIKEANKGADADWSTVAYKTTRGLSSISGIGFGNLWRDVNSVYQTIDEFVNRDSLAGAAWDTSLPFETRLAAAEKNYVMKKQGDGRKVNSGIYYDLMLAAYFDSGLGKDYKAAVDAAIRTGGTQDGAVNGFKSRLREVEGRLPQAAMALLEGDMDTYSRLYQEMLESGVGERPLASMINSELNELLPKDEEDPGSGEGAVGELQRGDVATDPRKKLGDTHYAAAVESEDPAKLAAAVDLLRESGMTDAELRKKVEGTYEESYCWAIWRGDRAAADKAAAMAKGAGVMIGNDDLKAWSSNLNGSYASDEMYRLMKEGDGKQAHIIHKHLIAAHSNDEMDKKLKKWCKNSVKGKECEANVRAALKQMGYSQSTINSWFQ